ncbi:MAK10-like protein [Tanacetum coccineum]
MWYLFDPTPSAWCKTDAHSMDFDPRIQKDFLKLVDSLDLDGENRERIHLHLFQFSLRDQASNWLERLPAGSITTWEDLTTRFLAQFFPLGRIAKLCNDIPIWNNLKDFAKPVKEISLPQDVPSTSDRRIIELENQVQRLMEAHHDPMQPTQVNKVTSSCEICSGPHDTQYYMENPEQAFVDYASSRTDGTRSRQFAMNQDQETLTKPPILGRESQTLTGHTPRHLPAHRTAHSQPTHLVNKRSLKRHF